MSIRNARIRRRGISLVETLAVMSVLSATMGIVAMSLGVMQRTSDRILDGLDHVNQRDRLAAQLRMDAHEASAVEWDNGEQGAESDPVLSLRMDADLTVQYHLYPDEIERVARAGATIQHRDTFFVRPDMAAGWAVDTDRPYPLVSLHLHPCSFGQLGDDSAAPPLRLDAAVGIGRIGSSTIVVRRER